METRRRFFASLVALPAALAAPRVASAASVARALVVPVCPDCGLHVCVDPGQYLPETKDAMMRASCQCGWRGEFPRSIAVPTSER